MYVCMYILVYKDACMYECVCMTVSVCLSVLDKYKYLTCGSQRTTFRSWFLELNLDRQACFSSTVIN